MAVATGVAAGVASFSPAAAGVRTQTKKPACAGFLRAGQAYFSSASAGVKRGMASAAPSFSVERAA